MLRIRIDMIPTGIEELAQTWQTVSFGCMFPLDNKRQKIMVQDAENFTFLENVNLDDLLYHPADQAPKVLQLAYMGLKQLLERGVEIPPDSYFPGMKALDPGEFDAKIADLVKQNEEAIEWIKLFGRRAVETISIENFKAVFKAELKRTGGKMEGEFLLHNWPEYVPYNLAAKIDRNLYQRHEVKKDGKRRFASDGEFMEYAIETMHTTRPFPNNPEKMICQNGLIFIFQRPDGSLVDHHPDGQIVAANWGKRAMDLTKMRHAIKAGNLIYDRKQGLQPYPGIKI